MEKNEFDRILVEIDAFATRDVESRAAGGSASRKNRVYSVGQLDMFVRQTPAVPGAS